MKTLHFDVERVSHAALPFTGRAAWRIVIHVPETEVIKLIASLARGEGRLQHLVSVHLDVNPHDDNEYPHVVPDDAGDTDQSGAAPKEEP